MKWFKHSSQANQDSKLKKVRMKYGLEGYGLYWYCLELIAKDVDTDKLTFELEHDSEILAFDLNIHEDRIKEMMTYMVNLGLFERIDNRITCFKLANMADEYLVKALSRAGRSDDLKKVRTMSGHNQDKVVLEKSRVDKSKGDNKKQLSSVSQAKSDRDEVIKKIFDYWRTVMGKDDRVKLSQKRKSVINARLNDGFEPREICEAIKGCSMTPHNMGANDRNKPFNDIELICRDDNKLTGFIETARASNRNWSAKTQQTINTLDGMEFE